MRKLSHSFDPFEVIYDVTVKRRNQRSNKSAFTNVNKKMFTLKTN